MLKQILQNWLLKPVNCVTETKKLCVKCQVEKPANQYHKSSNSQDGLQSYCKVCSYASKRKSKHARGKKKRYIVPRMLKGSAEKQRLRLNIEITGKQRLAIHELCIEKKMTLEKCCNLMIEQFLTLNGKETK